MSQVIMVELAESIYKKINRLLAELIYAYICSITDDKNRGRPVLTGCVITWVSMQAHGMRALKDSSTTQLANLITPWLLNLD